MKSYSSLLSEGLIGKMKVKNRVIMAPMATNFADSCGGVTPQMIWYYAERARGGVGLIIVENANVAFPLGVNGAVQLRIDEDRFIPGLACLREALNDADPTCRVALQINHAGGQTKSERTGGLQPVGPSNVPTRLGGEVPRPLSGEEIAELADKYALAALRAKKAGFDAVELHGGFAYLLAQFLSPYFNKRTDSFGGSTENRVNFARLIIRKTRELVGSNYPLLFRMNAEEFIDGGLALEESKIYARMLERESIDLVNVTAGSGLSAARHVEPMSFPQAWKVPLATEIKKIIKIPVAAVGVIREPDVADNSIRQGKTDFVVLGRTLIADPHWVNKAAAGKAVTRCISCNVCVGRRLTYDVPIRCSVNPVVGNEEAERERRRQSVAAKKVLIIGGGPAGLKAAVEAHADGHRVVLAERGQVLGGRGLIAAVPPHKEKVRWLVDDLIRQVEEAGIEVRKGITGDKEFIEGIRPDAVILAVGSDSKLPAFLADADVTKVMTAEDILGKGYKPTGLAIGVIGGGSVGCECAEYLAGNGNTVHLFEMLDEVAADLDPISRIDLLKRLTENGVAIKTCHRVKEIKQDSITCECANGIASTDADLIVFATGSRVVSPLFEDIGLLRDKYEVFVVGDCFKPGRFIDAIKQAYTAVRKIRSGR